MQPKDNTFSTRTGKRRILIVEDEFVNREILSMILSESYDVVTAEDGSAALALMREQAAELSLVLLDLQLPGMNGLDILRIMKQEPALKRIPVIVLTADHSAERESLELGAADFISKPYPAPPIILARVMRIIELFEDRETIQSTERDRLTDLYTPEYFYRYAEQYDHYHPGIETDAIYLDINHFHLINDRYGRAYGDEILCRVSERLKLIVHERGGLVCRQSGDSFLIYGPHHEDYAAILSAASSGLGGSEVSTSRIRLRMGVYPQVSKTIPIEHRFDRAKVASDQARGSFTDSIILYDEAMHESELYDEQLLEDFPTALREGQFKVYYQPKFNIHPDNPILVSAEALIRWKHPRLGMISPGRFIPLFEKNGLIRQLDHYVWRETARQIREWKDRLHFSVPVSVNVSRIDLDDPELIPLLTSLIRDYALKPEELLLEITESAYTQESSHLIEWVRELRSLGFKIEMDDFGTGYSSLNMLSSLPIDALKLDMSFVRNMLKTRMAGRMVEVIIDIGSYLEVPVIAEGVETKEQFNALREMGCDIVQGYYFSRPLTPAEYEPFILRRRDDPRSEQELAEHALSGQAQRIVLERELGQIAHALSEGFETIYHIDTETGHFVQFSPADQYADMQILRSGKAFFAEFRKEMEPLLWEEDRTRVLQSLQEEALLSHLTEERYFTLTYRIKGSKAEAANDVTAGQDGSAGDVPAHGAANAEPVYYRLKAIRAGRQSDNALVIGIRNVDEQIRREQELSQARSLASRDALTGVKTKHVYVQTEHELDQRIAEGLAEPFAIVYCDVNGLKSTNDTLGHDAGDRLLKASAHIICEIFRHSPVFRMGGDEFVVLLTGRDYAARAELLAAMYGSREQLLAAMQPALPDDGLSGALSIACGMAEYVPGQDARMADVLARADAAMYENKNALNR